MTTFKMILSTLLLVVALSVSTVPSAQGCDHDYDDGEVESEQMPS
jgi:hypothetical protein